MKKLPFKVFASKIYKILCPFSEPDSMNTCFSPSYTSTNVCTTCAPLYKALPISGFGLLRAPSQSRVYGSSVGLW